MQAPKEAVLPGLASPQDAIDTTARRLHLSKCFKHVLTVVPFVAIAAALCLIKLESYGWGEGPEHLCKLTGLTRSVCAVLNALPIVLLVAGMLTLIPVLLALDHFLALSPTFQHKPTSRPGQGHTAMDAKLVQSCLEVFEGGAKKAAKLWALASGTAVACAALVLMHDAPFDTNSDPKYRFRVYAGLAEAGFDLLLFFLMKHQASLFSSTRESSNLGAPAFNTKHSSKPTRATGAPNTEGGLRGLWARRTGLDKTCLCLAIAFLALIFANVLYFALRSSRCSPGPAYPFGRFYSDVSLFVYMFLFMFHSERTAATHSVLTVVVRGSVVLFLSYLSFQWLYFSASFLFASVYSLYCDTGQHGSDPVLGCPSRRSYIHTVTVLLIGVLNLLLAFSLGGAALNAWNSRSARLRRTEWDGVREAFHNLRTTWNNA